MNELNPLRISFSLLMRGEEAHRTQDGRGGGPVTREENGQPCRGTRDQGPGTRGACWQKRLNSTAISRSDSDWYGTTVPHTQSPNRIRTVQRLFI